MTIRLIPDATTGALLQYYLVGQSPAVETSAPLPNAGAPLEFDEETNAALLADVLVNHSQYTIVAGILNKNGNPVAINPDGEAETDRKAIPNRKAQIETYMGLSDLPVPTDLTDIAGGSNAAAIVAYINGTLVPRINQLDTLVQRTNANTNATQGIFQILRGLAGRFGWF